MSTLRTISYRRTRWSSTRRSVARAATGLICAALLVTSMGATAVASPSAAPKKYAPPKLQVFKPHDLSNANPTVAKTKPMDRWQPERVARQPKATFDLTTRQPGWARGSKDSPIEVKTAPLGATSSPGFQAKIWGSKKTEKLVSGGYVVALTPDPTTQVEPQDATVAGDPPTTPTDTETPTVNKVRLSYARLAGAGADFASRAVVRQYPACAQTDPSNPDCQQATTLRAVTDERTQTLTVTPDAAWAGDQVMVLALAAGESSETGDWSATPLSSASSWSSGGSSGAFTWGYPLRTPKVAAATAPELAVDYNSGSVDGRTVSENNQTSWLGEGFDLGTAYIERPYKTCADDGGPATKGDLCWAGDRQSVSFGKWSGELVRTDTGTADEGASTWRLRSDNGAVFERKVSTGFNGDNNGEYWVMTTPDGTQYVFGKRKVTTTGVDQQSAWTVPVFGNNTGEPCNAAPGWCNQVWRWNLDRVIDTKSNVTLYSYTHETNKYALNGSAATTYVRGGYLSKISYGLRNGAETVTAPAQVLFTVDERCKGTTTQCDPAQLTQANSSRWPDVPFDKICAGTTCPGNGSPTFFTRKKLIKVETQAYSAGAYAPVDRWTFVHDFLTPGDSTAPALNLMSVTHAGVVSTAVTLPATSFYYVGMPNRVDGIGDKSLPFYKQRVQQIVTESGSSISVDYSNSQCTPAIVGAIDEKQNDKRCFPQRFKPEGYAEQDHWFHKYVVDRVDVTDLSGSGSSDSVTRYAYLTTPAWAYQDRPGIKSKYRTYSQWRGYERVRTIDGEAFDSTPAVTETLYYRGMDGDRLTDNTTRKVPITDSNGLETDDHWRLTGMPREVETFTSVGGTRLTSEISTYDTQTVTTQGRNVVMAPLTGEDSRSFITGGAQFRTTNTHTYNAFGFVTESDQYARRISSGGTISQSQRQCTRTGYSQNQATWLMDRVSTEETVNLPCSTTSTTDVNIISSTRTYYDGGALGATPTAGNATKSESKLVGTGITTKWVATSTAYDAYGRVTSATDANNRTTTTVYASPGVAGGWPATTTTTTPDPDGTGAKTSLATITTSDVRMNAPTKVQAPNGDITEGSYDSLGRLAKVWNPGRAKTSSASTEYVYSLGVAGGAATGHNAVTTKTLLTNGTSYRTSVALYDGLLRPGQTQTQTTTRDGLGNPVTATSITDQDYNSRGQVIRTRPSVLATGSPTTTFQAITVSATVNETTTTYDAAGRVTKEALAGRNTQTAGQLDPLWETTYAYTGETTTTTPPTGGVATAATQNASGQTITRKRFPEGPATPATAVAYTYGYDKGGNLATISDPVSNQWEYTFDTLGRQLTSSDPDAGESIATYDDAGLILTSTLDPSGTPVERSYTYDALGRKTAEFVGTGAAKKQVYGWDYDVATNGKGLPASTTTYYNGVLIHTNKIDTYASGRPTKTTSQFATTAGVIPAAMTTAYSVTTSYMANGQPLTNTVPAVGDLLSEGIRTDYDALGRPNVLVGNGTYVRESFYTPTDEIQRLTLGNQPAEQVWNDYWYDNATHRPTQTYVDKQTTPNVDSQTTLTYDEAGNRTRVQDTNTTVGVDTQCFKRDGLGQLTAAWTPSDGTCGTNASAAMLGGPAAYRLAWTYDAPTGNRKTQTNTTTATTVTDTYSYAAPGTARPHAVNQVTRTGAPTVNYTYDARGNTTTRTGVTGGDQTLAWDSNNRLREVTPTAGGTRVQFQVQNPTGQRLLRVAGNLTTIYHPDGTEVTMNTDGTGTPDAQRHYTHAGRSVAHRAGTSTGTVTTLVTDAQGTVTYAYLNVAGTLTPYRQTPFGAPRGASAAPAGDGIPGERRFVGGTKDSVLDLIQIGTRPYDPIQGRFLTTDPIIDPTIPAQVAGAYGYGWNDPITNSDPSGEIIRCSDCVPGRPTPHAATPSSAYTGGTPTQGYPPATTSTTSSTSATHAAPSESTPGYFTSRGSPPAPTYHRTPSTFESNFRQESAQEAMLKAYKEGANGINRRMLSGVEDANRPHYGPSVWDAKAAATGRAGWAGFARFGARAAVPVGVGLTAVEEFNRPGESTGTHVAHTAAIAGAGAASGGALVGLTGIAGGAACVASVVCALGVGAVGAGIGATLAVRALH